MIRRFIIHCLMQSLFAVGGCLMVGAAISAGLLAVAAGDAQSGAQARHRATWWSGFEVETTEGRAP